MCCQYYYFVRLMGRKHSHVALECTLQSHPNMVFFLNIYNRLCWLISILFVGSYLRVMWLSQVILGEEVTASKLTIFDITKQICDAVQARAGQGLIIITSLCNVGSSDVFCLFTNLNDKPFICSRQKPWSHPNSWRDCREYSWTLCSAEGNL